MYAVYSALLALALVVGAPWFLYQAVRRRKYLDGLGQRLGALPVSFNLDGEPSIWIHAVSVGEVLAARPLADELKSRYPGLKLFVSTTTTAGQHLAKRQIHEADGHFYFPIDFGWIVRRVFDRVRPRLFVLMEGEIWPNVLRECTRREVKTLVVNGRVSTRSFARYRLIRPLLRRVLAGVGSFCMQSDESARRIMELGAEPARVTVTGSLKFDAAALTATTSPQGRPRDRVLRYFRVSHDRMVIVAGSTMRGEELPVLRAFRRIKLAMPSALLIVAPRHQDRFTEVTHIARGEGFSVLRRSELAVDADPRADVVVLDSIGELASIYQIATVAFVGGSLVPVGGHNILEPAVHGRPVVFGPYMSNFAEIAEMFLASGAAVQVASESDLESMLIALTTDPVRRAALGAAARALVDANRGATARTLDVVARLLPRPAVVRPFRRVH
jgi:3-deoxy-D-manno-octulosonic-acid transferase